MGRREDLLRRGREELSGMVEADRSMIVVALHPVCICHSFSNWMPKICAFDSV